MNNNRTVYYKSNLHLSDEVILLHELFSTRASAGDFFTVALNESEFDKAYNGLKNKHRLFFEWDLLENEEFLDQKIEKFEKIIQKYSFDAIRVRDLGVLHYLVKNHSQLAKHLILENGSLNSEAIIAFCNYVGTPLERIVFSPQFSYQQLTVLRDNLDKIFKQIDFEYMAVGPVLLTVTPRQILSYHKEQSHYVLMDSSELPGKYLRVCENNFATNIYHYRMVDLVKEYSSEEMKLNKVITCWRFDLLTFEKLESFKTFRGFFDGNKTHNLFKRLKNTNLSRDKQTVNTKGEFFGEVVALEKTEYLAIKLLKKNFPNLEIALKEKKFLFVTPEGKEKVAQLKLIFNFTSNEIILIAPIAGISVRSQVYQCVVMDKD